VCESAAGGCGGLILSIVMTRAVTSLQVASWRHLTDAVLESERTGSFTPDFPMKSSLREVNRQAAALNAAARSVLSSQADLDRTYLQFVETMAQALDARDPYTAGHSLRVAEYSHALAKAMDLSDEDAETIRVAAQLHDIGKIGIPDAVLCKAGPADSGRVRADQAASADRAEDSRKGGAIRGAVVGGRTAPRKSRRVGGIRMAGGLRCADRGSDCSRRRFVRCDDVNRSYRPALSLTRRDSGDREKLGEPIRFLWLAKAFLRLIAEGAIEIGGLKISAQGEMKLVMRGGWRFEKSHRLKPVPPCSGDS